MNIKKILLGFLGVFILAVGIAIGAYLVKNNQDIREKAEAATTTYISPSTQNVKTGEDFSFYVKMDSGVNQIIGVDIRLSFDPNVFQITSLEKGANAGNLDGTIVTTFDNATGKIKYIIFTADKTKAISGNGLDILKVNVKSKTDAPDGIYSISFDSETIASGISENQNILTSLTPGSVNLSVNNPSNRQEGEPNKCGGTCGSNYNCAMNFFCYQGFCRNPVCKEDADCDCIVPTIKPTIKATIKSTSQSKGAIVPTSTLTAKPLSSSSSLNLNENDDLNLTRPEEDANQAANFDYKLIALIAGILIGIFLLYKGIKSLKNDKTNPPKIDLGQPQTFTDTVQTPQ